MQVHVLGSEEQLFVYVLLSVLGGQGKADYVFSFSKSFAQLV